MARKFKFRDKKEKEERKRNVFNKGYAPVEEKIIKSPRFYTSCYNCYYFYMGKYDEEEVCHNDEVLEFDMVITASNICCSKWCPYCKEPVKDVFAYDNLHWTKGRDYDVAE